MFEDCVCPMTAETIKRYGLTNAEIERFCDKGCSVICGSELKNYLRRKGRLGGDADGQSEVKTVPGNQERVSFD